MAPVAVAKFYRCVEVFESPFQQPDEAYTLWRTSISPECRIDEIDKVRSHGDENTTHASTRCVLSDTHLEEWDTFDIHSKPADVVTATLELLYRSVGSGREPIVISVTGTLQNRSYPGSQPQGIPKSGGV